MSGRRPLYGWLTAEAISLCGTRISMIALPWFVLSTTGSVSKTGLVALFEMLPMVLLKVLGGPVIDRLGARRVAIVCDLGSMAVVGSIPLLHAADALSFPLFLGLVGLAGAFRGPGDASKGALIPQIVAVAGVPTERATGLHSTVERLASMLGAAIAGGLVVAVGASNALALDAVSFGVSAAVLAWSTTRLARAGAVDDDQGDETYVQQLRAGWSYLRGDRVLMAIALMVAITNVIDAAAITVLMPYWAHEYGAGVGALGIVIATFSGSATLGSVGASIWGSRLPRFAVYVVGFLVAGAPRFVVFAFDSPLGAVLAVSVIGGFGAGFINPIIGAIEFERIPSRLVGRVSSLITAIAFALMPFGGMLGAGLIGWFGFTVGMLVAGGAYFVVTMAPALDPKWRDLDRPQERDDTRRGTMAEM